MRIKTKAFGEIEISDKQKLNFVEGILGFEELHEFALLDSPEGGPFYWLQALKVPDIAFVVIDPDLVVNDYQLQVDDKDLEELGIENLEDILVFSIVTIHSDPQNITANLLGPIIINKKNHKAKQIVSLSDNYSVRHPLMSGKGE